MLSQNQNKTKQNKKTKTKQNKSYPTPYGSIEKPLLPTL
jgi:hypothetical protein